MSGLSEMNSTRNVMTLARLTVLLDTYGARTTCWPEDEQASAEALISSNADARSLMDEAHAFDAVMDRSSSFAVPADLSARIMASFDRVASRPSVRRIVRYATNLVWPGAPLWQPSAALAASVAAGLVLGILSPLGAATHTPSQGSDMTLAMEIPSSSDLTDGL